MKSCLSQLILFIFLIIFDLLLAICKRYPFPLFPLSIDCQCPDASQKILYDNLHCCLYRAWQEKKTYIELSLCDFTLFSQRWCVTYIRLFAVYLGFVIGIVITTTNTTQASRIAFSTGGFRQRMGFGFQSKKGWG